MGSVTGFLQCVVHGYRYEIFKSFRVFGIDHRAVLRRCLAGAGGLFLLLLTAGCDSDDNRESVDSRDWVQVSRLGMPLVNEVVIPLADKNKFNASQPRNDHQFLPFVLDPEPARLIPVLYPGVSVPAAPRSDLVAIFLTGISGLNQPPHVRPSEMIRLNMGFTPSSSPNRLGLLAGQNDGFPNGRRLIDDVVDIELRALAGGTPFTPTFNLSPNNILTDGVDTNDQTFLSTFPYVPLPSQGYDRQH